jgi:hypothetical protein
VMLSPAVSPPIMVDVSKFTTYCVLAPAAGDGEPWATVRLETELALAAGAPIRSAATNTRSVAGPIARVRVRLRFTK